MSNKAKHGSPDSLATYACYLGFAIAAVILLYGMNLIMVGSDDLMVYKFAVVTIGVLEALICMFSLQGSRTAWSFGLSLNGTLTVVFIFGAAKVQGAINAMPWVADNVGQVTLVVGFVPAVAFIATTVMLALSSDDY